jgi:serine protease Do
MKRAVPALAFFFLVVTPALAQQSKQPEPYSYRDIVKTVLPAVVSIQVTDLKPSARARSRDEDFNLPGGSTRDMIDEQLRRPRAPSTGQFGSGVIIDPKGIIVTNHHVVDGAAVVKVTLHDGRTFTSRAIFSDPKTDLAVVKLDARKIDQTLPSIPFGDSNQLEIGDRVLAIGAPFGLEGTVTHGIISAKGRSNINLNIYEDYLQTDAAINPGNSGGPLVNLEGKVIGINTAIQTRTGTFGGVGLAIPSEMAKEVCQKLIEHGKVRRGYLGVMLIPLDNKTINSLLGIPDGKGVGVGTITTNTPADKAGLHEGDVILTLGGNKVENLSGLKKIIADSPIGKPVSVGVLRDTKLVTLPVTIEEQPENFGFTREVPRRAPGRTRKLDELDPTVVPKVGVEVIDLVPDILDAIGLSRNTTGALIWSVDQESLAGDAQLSRGVIVCQVDRKAVKTAEEFKAAIGKGDVGKGILLLVKRPDGSSGFMVIREGGE